MGAELKTLYVSFVKDRFERRESKAVSLSDDSKRRKQGDIGVSEGTCTR